MEVRTHKAELLRRPASARRCLSPDASLNARHRTASANGLLYGTSVAAASTGGADRLDASASYTVGHLSRLLRAVDPTTTLAGSMAARERTAGSDAAAVDATAANSQRADGRDRARTSAGSRSDAGGRLDATGIAKSRWQALDLATLALDGDRDAELTKEIARNRSARQRATTNAQQTRPLNGTSASRSAPQAEPARDGEQLRRQRSRSAVAAPSTTEQMAASVISSRSALSSTPRSATSSEAAKDGRRATAAEITTLSERQTERRQSDSSSGRFDDGVDQRSTLLFQGSRMGLTASGALAFPGEEQPEESTRLARIMSLAERCAEQAFDLEPPVPRVKPEAYDNAELAKGRRMAKILHKYGDVTPRPRDPPRVKPEGEPNAALDRGRRMALLVHSYGRLPPSPRQPPRVKPEAEEIAHHGRNGLVRHLLDSYGRLPPSPRPQARVRREARSAAHRARGTAMKRALTDMGKKQFIYVPGLQTRKHERTVTI